MSRTNVEQRISALERKVAELARSGGPAGRTKDWKRTVGMFSGNELMKEVDAAGRNIRQQDRRQARRRHNGKRRRNAK